MAPHGLCPGAQILTIRPLAVSSVPATAQSLLLLLAPGRHAGVVAAARAAQCVPAFQHVCCCNYSLGGALGALRATIPVCAFCPDGLTIVRRRDCGSGLQRALSAWQQPLLQGAAACGRHLLATPCGLRY